MPGASGAASRAGAASSTLSTASEPMIVVKAPGSGVTPRTRACTASTGESQWMRASSRTSFGASVTSPSCGRATAVPAASSSTTRAVRAAPELLRLSSSAPAVRWAPIGSSRRAYQSPSSRPSVSWKTVAPVRSSPAMIARCTGAAPRQAGSSEKCRLIQPSRGHCSSGSRTRPP